MKPYYDDESVTLYRGDALAVLRELPDASVDCERELDRWWLCSHDESEDACPYCFDTWPLHVFPCPEAAR